jgi:hypothetical protein
VFLKTRRKYFFEILKSVTGGAHVGCRDKDGFTALHRCCQEAPAAQKKEDSSQDTIQG